MPPKRRRAWVGFALCAVLAAVFLFMVDGAVAGAGLFVTMLAFIGICIYAMNGEDPETRARSDRTGLAGWFGGWF